ncbi:hypothetical protein LSH36_315g00018 [Paralvinella palmiformis]|uniref:Gamma-tubulin complex component n=1 Tax=Paralvinella palmiformis TaxID=53620 RepID=A0AAD9JGU2_9ANNE|nr:hypothetical protein LSH36_315g00018 [Paralvinella palmiformis]
MLHELLLALSGYPGGIFVKRKDGEIEIVKELPFISPNETALLSRLCQIASYYHYFITFIRTHSHKPNKETGLCGLYLKALCQGVDRILDPYRQKLLDVEKELLSDPHLTAAHVQSALHQYSILFPAIKLVLEEIIQHKAHGCYILEILHRSAVNGIPAVRQALQRILHVCHSVMYKQLAAWMLHGMLLDQDNEFFIKRVRRDGEPANTMQVEEDELGLGGLTGRQVQQMMLVGDDLPVTTVSELYTIQADKLPSYIPTRIAQQILFVGESVLMFESDLHVQTWQLGEKGTILYGCSDEFAKDIHNLSTDEEFDLMAFEATISKMKSYVAEKLWHVIVQEADLPGNLRIMKDFYLLGRGELFLTFIDKAHSLLRSIPTATTEHDVNMAFQHSARNVLLEDESLLQRFHLTVDSGTRSTDKTQTQVKQQQRSSADGSTGSVMVSGWNLLRLTCRVERPLHIMFTPSVIDRYNTLFQFLLRVKRVQLELQQCWALQMQQKHLGRVHDISATHWWLRNHMIFLIDNLQYYLQVDVIESQFSLLLEKIQNTPDFEEIRLAHDAFLTSLLSQSFLLMKPISNCLDEILDICHGFCSLMIQSDLRLNGQQEKLLRRHNTGNKQFQRQSGLLFTYLSNVRGHQASSHLAQLLLRIDYNKYFTVVSGQLGK